MFHDTWLMPALPGPRIVATGLPLLSVMVIVTGLHSLNGGAWCFLPPAGLLPFFPLSAFGWGAAFAGAGPLFWLSSPAQPFGTATAFASEYAITGPLGGLGAVKSPGAGPMWRPPNSCHSVPVEAGKRWNASFAIEGCHCSSAWRLSRIHRPRPWVASTRSCGDLVNFRSHTAIVGRLAVIGSQCAPSSNDRYRPRMVPSASRPFRFGSSRTTTAE